MKPFAERNPFFIGLVGVLSILAIVVAALQYNKLPLINAAKDYSAYFAEAGGLRPGAAVQVAGYRVGEVTSVDLDGPRVLVTFNVDKSVHLGDLTEANIRTKSLLGAKVLQVTPRGSAALTTTIPIERTRSPYQLPDALGDLSATISSLDTTSVSDALATLAATFKDTPEELQVAVEGVGRFSQTLATRDEALRNMLANASKATEVLSARADQLVELIADSNALMAELQNQSAALRQISGNLSKFAQQLSGFISENRTELRPTLDKLNKVLEIVDNRKDKVTQAIRYINQYALGLGESLASGPWFTAALANLLPGQFMQPFIDAAFSDLGLDPSVLLPTERTDPQTGQPATPPLPVPFPRTGQGGEPRLTLPDAITGNPGDQPCPLPGPGCYPYREPPPAPPPGGPPPGPPAPGPSGPVGPTPVYVPAPGEPETTAPANGGQ